MKDSSADSPSWLKRLKHKLTHEPQTRDDLIALLTESVEKEIIDDDELRMMERVMQVTESQVRDIMIPRSQMIVLEYDAKTQEFLPLIIHSHHSRFPVIGENPDEIIGILLAKDLLRYLFKDDKKFKIQDVMRPAIFIPESKRIDTLLDEFRLNRNHMAIVVDEYGGIAGLVTIEDVLEEIVGEIEDEFDVAEDANIKQLNETEYIVKALTEIEEFNQHFLTSYSDEEFDTVGGYVTHQFGHLPKRGESTMIEDLHFKVLHADNRRPRLFRVTTATDLTTEEAK